MPSQIDDIKARLDIVELVQSYVRLHKAGSNYKALCPFHSEKTPSFNVSPARQIWHCFGCGLGGDHFTFIMQIEGIEFPEALELLAKRAGVQLTREDPRLKSERQRLHALLEEAARLFEAELHRSPDPDLRISPQRAYLNGRGLRDETIRAWRIGYAPDAWDWLGKHLRAKGYRDEEIAKAGLSIRSEEGRGYYDRFRNRITFPISDASGRVVGFSGRIFESPSHPASGSKPESRAKESSTNSQENAGTRRPEAVPAKYINTPQTLVYDKSRVLYGFDRAKEAIRRENAVVLVEGQMDVVMSHQAGVANAVAASGTALSADQLRVLQRLAATLISSFDRDAAGEAATKRSMDLAAAFGFERSVATLPAEFKDPADAAAADPTIWQRAVQSARPLVQFFLDAALSKHDPSSAAGRRAIAGMVLPEIAILSSEVEKAHWIQKLSAAIRIGEEALARELAKTGKSAAPRGSRDAKTFEKPSADQPDARQRQLEALMLGALILAPGQRSRLPSLPVHAIAVPEHREIADVLTRLFAERDIADYDALLDALPDELSEQCRLLAFQAETILERIENEAERSRELLVAATELERAWIRQRLNALAEDISRAEAGGEQERLAALLEEFRAMSAKMS